MVKRMIIMLVIVGLLFGGIFGYRAYQGRKLMQSMAGGRIPPVTVSTTKATFQPWQPQLKAVGSLRAVRGIDVTSEITGLVRTIHFQSGTEVKEGDLLVQLNADADIAQLQSLEAAAELASIVHERDTKQFAVQAVSQATLDTDASDLKSKQAQVAQQKALIAKKTIRAPFSGRLGISTVNPGQYVNPGDKIVTLQALDSIYADFYLPQQELSRLSSGQQVTLTTDSYPDQTFTGKISAINPKVDQDTRNFLIEATVANPRRALLPGMYASVDIQAGRAQRYLTVPQAAVTFNPYGNTVFVIQQGGPGPDGKPVLTAKETFVTVGGTRGDQIAIIKGVKEGDIVVTGGQLKLKNGSAVIVNNQVQPTNAANPMPVDE
jgi:membrane fusion protein, multidrug efflux system